MTLADPSVVGEHGDMNGVSAGRDGRSGAAVTLDFDEGPDVDPGHDLLVVGHGTIVKQRKGVLVAPEAVIVAADIESLAAATRDERRCCRMSPEPIYVALGDEATFDEELFDADPVHLEIGDDYVYACVDVLVTRPAQGASTYRTWMERAVSIHGCGVASVRLTDQYGNEPEDIEWHGGGEEYEEYLIAERARPRIVSVRIEALEATTMESLLAAGRDAHLLLTATSGREIDVVAARIILRAGLPHLLLGLPESEWLEVKSKAYGLSAPGSAAVAAKIELAQDVARFANGDSPGLLIIGLATRRHDGGEILSRIAPIGLDQLSGDQYRAVIDERVIPTIEGLRVDRIDLGDASGVLVIDIPAQPTEFKPFLVHGAIVGDRIEGAFISVVRRRGDGSITMTATQIHAMLAAGRALLRGETPRE